MKKREENIMTDGHRYTVPAAKHLRSFIINTGFDIVFDHGDATESQEIVAWFGERYEPPYRPKQLAHLDIFIFDPATAHIIALVEIEDTTHNPKTLIGDLIAPQIADGIALGTKAIYTIGSPTSLIIFANFKSSVDQDKYQKRIEHIQQNIAMSPPFTQRTNQPFCKCILDSFTNQEELNYKLGEYIQKAIKEYKEQ